MKDIWRRIHPDSKHFTYQGNQATNPKSWLDRIRLICENWPHQTNSAMICPYFADHAGYNSHPRKRTVQLSRDSETRSSMTNLWLHDYNHSVLLFISHWRREYNWFRVWNEIRNQITNTEIRITKTEEQTIDRTGTNELSMRKVNLPKLKNKS
jgi:hypothetical protein